LGKISCSNAVKFDSDDFNESYTIEIKNTYVYSLNIDETEYSFNVHPAKNKDAIPILHDTAITLHLYAGYGEDSGQEKQLNSLSVSIKYARYNYLFLNFLKIAGERKYG